MSELQPIDSRFGLYVETVAGGETVWAFAPGSATESAN